MNHAPIADRDLIADRGLIADNGGMRIDSRVTARYELADEDRRLWRARRRSPFHVVRAEARRLPLPDRAADTVLLRAVRLTETEPSMLGVSAHVLGVARTPSARGATLSASR